MRAAFADADYWIATVDDQDRLHLQARTISRSLGGVHIVTTELVLTELLNHVAGAGPIARIKVAKFVRDLRLDPSVTVILQADISFEDALIRYERYRDKQWGLTDCASFVVMEQLVLTDALAYDHHFQQAGFRALLRDS